MNARHNFAMIITALVAIASSARPAAASDPSSTKSPPTVTAGRLSQPLVIDGVLDEPAYPAIGLDRGGVVTGWRLLKASSPTLAEQNRIAYVSYDDQHLYIGMQAYVVDIIEISASENVSPFRNDSVEVHLNLPGSPERRYFQIGVDALGNVAAGQIEGFADINAIFAESRMYDNFWTVEIALPWNFLGVNPEEGLSMGFNLAANVSHQGTASTARQPITWSPSFTVRNDESLLILGPPLPVDEAD